MEFGADERAQSVLVGSILLFAILIVAFSTYQAFVVPDQNAEVEFSHSQQVENEFSELRSNVINAVESGDERSTSVTLGTQYPARLLALNPPAPAGTISTTEPSTVEVDGVDMANVCGVDESGETTTRSLVYEPGYNEYPNAESTVYEHTFVTTTFRNGESVPRTQRLIRDDRIDLLVLTGDVSVSRTTAYGVDINASHRHSYRTIEDPVVRLPSQFTADTWEARILEGRDDVLGVEGAGEDRVEIELDGSFEVTCAVVGLNSDPAFQPPTKAENGGANSEEGGSGTSPATFDSLEGEVTETRGGGTEAAEVTFSYTLSSDASSVEFEVEDGLGSNNVQTGPTDGGTGHDVRIDTRTSGEPEDDYPLALTAETDSGACYTAIIAQADETPTLSDGDWMECS
ncbi:MAG: hypothetical protein ACQET5_01300 [Halobacteriota archaeon]|uniref:hypothetical protein n=1 Tax=Natronomonas sp. TaxID=2184060 RepID=UPI003975425B